MNKNVPTKVVIKARVIGIAVRFTTSMVEMLDIPATATITAVITKVIAIIPNPED